MHRSEHEPKLDLERRAPVFEPDPVTKAVFDCKCELKSELNSANKLEPELEPESILDRQVPLHECDRKAALAGSGIVSESDERYGPISLLIA